MRAIVQYVQSSIGSKQLMGLTGLGLCLFLLIHMAGNTLILVGPEAFNTYAYKLEENPFLEVAEVALLVTFLIHVVKGIIVSAKNRSARPIGYKMLSRGEKHTTPVSRTLLAQGVIIFVFVIIHLLNFKFGPTYKITYGTTEMRDLYKVVLEVFKQPGYVAGYIFALLILSLHLGHGFYSSFQTLGVNSPKYTPAIKTMGYFYDVVVVGGFVILPLYVYFIHA